MKKIFFVAFTGFALLGSGAVMAKADATLIKEATKNVVTVSKAKTLDDESGVTLTGTIVKHIAGDHFEFKDATGSIVIDIDDDLWKPLELKVGDKVRVVGEVDKHRVKPTDIEVFQIERVK
ncbi:NirD/YgiW/YdeI family stress tolerance protein [Acinetobacter pittii]|uniref:NirD/YgiW/YdeI family stress tolerance protein n=1 Tax=Acinetobacter pittii TaxID=48296 RepID=UPI0018FFE576|nr:NirD/YgiW/YdeI family stress tolerance protein [Acinetobacter pittii]MBJ9938070.1 NirD/YgiW/YdeI family stress tolerance protein [Acinetobacter pittii]